MLSDLTTKIILESIDALLMLVTDKLLLILAIPAVPKVGETEISSTG